MPDSPQSAVTSGAAGTGSGAASAASEPAASTSAKTRLRLLVVDDEAAIREVTSAMLAEQGYEILTAEDGLQALELLPQFRPHLVVTDLRMPRMTGFELLKIIRERFPRLPVIAVSGEFSGDELPPNVAADAFLPKGGCYITALGAKIMELLSSAATSMNPRLGEESNTASAD